MVMDGPGNLHEGGGGVADWSAWGQHFCGVFGCTCMRDDRAGHCLHREGIGTIPADAYASSLLSLPATSSSMCSLVHDATAHAISGCSLQCCSVSFADTSRHGSH